MRFLSLIVAVLCLTACGFSPMYSEQSKATSVASGLDQISISIIPDREGQFLRNALIDRFYTNGEPTSAPYTLIISPINEKVHDFDITVDSEATRRQLKLNTQMSLRDMRTNKIVLSRPLLATTSHNVLESEFSTLVTEQSSREAALSDIARQIERQLALYFSQN